MGDRANIYLYDSSSANGIYVYTHWSGYRWPAALQEALIFGKGRWGDPQYLSRIIVSRVFRDLVDSETGGGLSTELCDNEYPLLCVDLVKSEVGLCNAQLAPSDRKNWAFVIPFEEFININDDDDGADWGSFEKHQN